VADVSRPIPIEDRVWKFVDKRPGGCWIWTGALVNGYGRVSYRRKSMLATRVVWLLTRGTIPDGMELCHNCPGGDNRACVNPDHLFIGEHADNMRDAKDKGTMSRGLAHSAIMLPLVQHGEQRPLAKLTDAHVREMRHRAGHGESCASLAREFGVHRNTAQKAITGRTWRHL